MPKRVDRLIRKGGGAVRYRMIKRGGKLLRVAVVRKKGPRGGQTVAYPVRKHRKPKGE